MNEFIEQFILESRDLAEQATSALTALEQSPHDAAALDALFRAFHTLKGGASIVEFAAMERAVHAAEDLLSQARSAKSSVTLELIADCLACLDQVVRWLDSMETVGAIPPDTDAQADLIVARFGHANAPSVKDKSTLKPNTASWLADFLKRHPENAAAAKTAVRFIPRPDCFFRGEDPLAIVAALPDLLSLELDSVVAWPVLNALDPYECNLVLTALTASSAQDVRAHLQDHSAECEVLALGSSLAPDELTSPDHVIPTGARSLLEAQVALFEDLHAKNFAGRIGSIGMVAANVLRYCRQNKQADLLARATDKSLSENDAHYLKEQIGQVLAPATVHAVSPSPLPPLPESSSRTLRVDAGKIDALVRLTGELTVVKNAVGHTMKLAQSTDVSLAGTLKNHHSTLDQLIGELQSTVLGMRVLPLRTVLQRFPRIVREMCVDLDKQVKLIIEGDDTTADKAVVEMLFEPLLHIVRNSMDHGIENPTLRAAKNKSTVATIVMRASREGEHVLVEVIDDGSGIDVARIRDVALERGVVSADELATMNETDIIGLVFAPGFSTASQVTELSGRGVGMDAVRTAIARISGRVSIESRVGEGTTVRFILPVSIMMTHVMTVEAGGQIFGIPLEAIVETIRVPVSAITNIGAGQVIVRRNLTMPLFELANLLRVRDVPKIEQEAVVVIASFAGQLGGIRVDRVGERMVVMLKPLDGLLSGIQGITGTTILGDGKVLLVLDLEGVLQ
jgi:two-component system chemotaxis sensor kinase CheA